MFDILDPSNYDLTKSGWINSASLPNNIYQPVPPASLYSLTEYEYGPIWLTEHTLAHYRALWATGMIIQLCLKSPVTINALTHKRVTAFVKGFDFGNVTLFGPPGSAPVDQFNNPAGIKVRFTGTYVGYEPYEEELWPEGFSKAYPVSETTETIDFDGTSRTLTTKVFAFSDFEVDYIMLGLSQGMYPQDSADNIVGLEASHPLLPPDFWTNLVGQYEI